MKTVSGDSCTGDKSSLPVRCSNLTNFLKSLWGIVSRKEARTSKIEHGR
jgi:hypothetical protein